MERLKFWLGQTLVDDAADVPPETGLTQAVAGVMLNCMFGRTVWVVPPAVIVQPFKSSPCAPVVLAKVVVDVTTWPCEVQVVLSKQISTNKLSAPFQVKGVVKVCVYHPVAVMFIVVGPKTVV